MPADALAVLWRQAIPVPPTTQQFTEFAAIMGWLPDRSVSGLPVALPSQPEPRQD